MNKIIGYLFPVILLLIFIFIMNASDFIKNDDINRKLNMLNGFLLDEHWDKASKNLQLIKNKWQRNVRLLQFSVERSEIRNINTGIARLRGSLIARDKSAALIELTNIKQTWNHLGN